jgi:hypothetical protein
MTLHEMIFVKHDPKEHGVWMDDNWKITHEGFAGPDKRFEVVPQRDVIVMSVDELKEMCGTIVAEWIEVKPPGSIDKDIEQDVKFYLKDKGILI